MDSDNHNQCMCDVFGHSQNTVIAICANSTCKDPCYMCGICAMKLHKSHSDKYCVLLTDILNKKFVTDTTIVDLRKHINEQLDQLQELLDIKPFTLTAPFTLAQLVKFGQYLRNENQQSQLQKQVCVAFEQISKLISNQLNNLRGGGLQKISSPISKTQGFYFNVDRIQSKLIRTSDDNTETILVNPAINQVNQDIINIKFKIIAAQNIKIGLQMDQVQVLAHIKPNKDIKGILDIFSVLQQNPFTFQQGSIIQCQINKTKNTATWTIFGLRQLYLFTMNILGTNGCFCIESTNSVVEIID